MSSVSDQQPISSITQTEIPAGVKDTIQEEL